MLISVMECVNLKAIISKKITELISERREVSQEVVTENIKSEIIGNRTFDVVTDDIIKHVKYKTFLDESLSRANLDNMVPYKNSSITVTAALSLLKYMRYELMMLEGFASKSKKRDITTSFRSENITVTEYKYDILKVKDDVEKLKKELNRLSIEIDKVNADCTIEIPFASEFI